MLSAFVNQVVVLGSLVIGAKAIQSGSMSGKNLPKSVRSCDDQRNLATIKSHASKFFEAVDNSDLFDDESYAKIKKNIQRQMEILLIIEQLKHLILPEGMRLATYSDESMLEDYIRYYERNSDVELLNKIRNMISELVFVKWINAKKYSLLNKEFIYRKGLMEELSYEKNQKLGEDGIYLTNLDGLNEWATLDGECVATARIIFPEDSSDPRDYFTVKQNAIRVKKVEILHFVTIDGEID